jgi:transcription termination factor Rho
MDPSVLSRKPLAELKDIASSLEMRGYQRLRKADLIEAIVRTANAKADPNQAARADNGNGVPHQASLPTDEAPETADGQGTGRQREETPAASDGETGGRPEKEAATAGGDEAGGRETSRDDAVAEQPRTRVRTRSRERGGDVEADGQTGEETEARPTGGKGGTASGEGGAPQRGDGGSDGEAQRDDEDGNRRRRRNRRDRRRGKGQGQGQDQQQQQQPQELGEVREGVLDILPEGYGFIRTSGLLPGDRDAYVSQSIIRKMGLRRGDVVAGPIRPQRNQEKVPALAFVEKVNDEKPDAQGNLPHRPDFKDMTPLFPDERLRLETPDGPISMRIVDLMAPIGKGQRGLIVSPPKAGKTTVLKELGQAIAYNNPDCHVMIVLVDERPEEVTDMQRSVPGEVIASTFDRPADDHTQISELAIERAKRLVEQGRDVVILLDSITRLSRAYNLAAPASGRILSGGVDSTALYPPKRFFGAARNIEGGGSLTIMATALIETGSKMDEVIFEEFKGTGNMELRLDRKLEQKRIFPAIDIEASGTRKEELLLDREELEIIWKLRRVLHALEGPSALELLIDKMKATRSNNQFLVQIQKSNLQT